MLLLLYSEADCKLGTCRKSPPPLLKDSFFFNLKKSKQISYKRYINIYRKKAKELL